MVGKYSSAFQTFYTVYRRGQTCSPQRGFSALIAVTGQLVQAIPFVFFSDRRPAAYKKVGYRLLVSVHYIPGWLSTKNRQINLHFFPWPAVCTPTFLP